MSIYLDRITRVFPPNAAATVGPGAQRVLACNVGTTVQELDNDIFQLANPSGVAVPGTVGPALVRFHAEGADIYMNFGANASISANSAATSGANTMCERIPAGQDRDFELSPYVHKFMAAQTQSGQTFTATLRYRIISPPTQTSPASG